MSGEQFIGEAYVGGASDAYYSDASELILGAVTLGGVIAGAVSFGRRINGSVSLNGDIDGSVTLLEIKHEDL